ncbi:MAG: nucleoside hydrolase [Acidobacteriota bacterium]
MRTLLRIVLCSAIAVSAAQAQSPRLVVADQDAMGPGGSDMRGLMVFLQSPEVKLLGITTVVGDGWMHEETAHTLRMLELLGRTDVPVHPGAAHPLWRTREWTNLASQMWGKAAWEGAWGASKHAWDEVPNLREGNPTTKASTEDAAHFLVRMVHEHPNEVTIYGAGPLTNIALAISLDPHFAELARELVIMGGSINPVTEEKEWTNAPRHEFNFWFDPEAASITLRAPWKKISITTIDASIRTRIAPELTGAMTKSKSAAARYLDTYISKPVQGVAQFAWDELASAAWLRPRYHHAGTCPLYRRQHRTRSRLRRHAHLE